MNFFKPKQLDLIKPVKRKPNPDSFVDRFGRPLRIETHDDAQFWALQARKAREGMFFFRWHRDRNRPAWWMFEISYDKDPEQIS